MDLDQLATAIALVRHGTVNRTAAALGLAPSSVSGRVRTLERELGTHLFTRDHRGMHPTAAARAYLAEAERTITTLRSAERLLVGPTTAVTVGAQASIADSLLPDLMSELSERRPDLTATIRPEADRLRLLAALEAGEIDAALLLDTGAALGGLGYPTPSTSLDFADLREVRMVTVVRPGHALLGRRLTQADVRSGATLIGREEGCSFWLATQRWLGPDVDLTAVGGLAQVRDWVARGRGAAVLPDFAVRDDLSSGRLAVLDAATPPLMLRLVWRSDGEPSEPVRALRYTVSQA